MNQDSKELRKMVEKQGEKLAKLGMEIGKMKFSYKIEEKASRKYWQRRIDEFNAYSKMTSEYYIQVYTMINAINEEEAQMFLLRTSKFRQLGSGLIEIMEKIVENPSIIDPKDKQQSQWSRGIKSEITEHSNKCLQHEIGMNSSFREFYDEHLKKMME